MAVVKANSYGTAFWQLPHFVNTDPIDYFVVAYAHEATPLLRWASQKPIIVMAPEVANFHYLVQHRLEPVLHSIELLKAFNGFCEQTNCSNYPVHIKINTGMNRLGLDWHDIEQLLGSLSTPINLNIVSAMSHYAASGTAEQDNFSALQVERFNNALSQLKKRFPSIGITHISNTNGALRHPISTNNMVRIGIGMYGMVEQKLGLQQAIVWKTTIAAIRTVPMGETIGYERATTLAHTAAIAVIQVGYADGYSRKLGNQCGRVFLHNQLAPIVGNVCMDMIMIDVSGIANVAVGDEVELFGNNLSIHDMAKWAGTIPYEIICGVGERVKRVYHL
ncbi:unnamed protein product [Rotaria socialis]|uniref:Alanine racemase C-terminal domain-containing protein n=1 Tax=Rotaria socialis TaxID=392032 RepID=A0A817WMT4_9BILA|nr:unnamed protein product [Rotaria socialis]CAF4646272.1 unnamed protein product [Rotaria socialis]